MDIVERVLGFKRKWLVKLIYQISDLYETPINDLKWERNIDEFLNDCIDSYLENVQIDDSIIDDYYLDIDEELINKVDMNLFKIVLYTFNKPKYIISNYSFMNLVFISIILESTLDTYRLSFENYNKDDIEDIIKDNIIGISFIRYKRKPRKINVINGYLDYISKEQVVTFGLLNDKDLNFNFIRLLNEEDMYVSNYDLNINGLINYDEDIVNEVKEDKNVDNKLLDISYALTRLKIDLINELQREKINKVLYVLDDNITKDNMDYINSTSKNNMINDKIILVSKDLKQTYSTKLQVAYYYDDVEKVKSATIFKDKIIIVNKSFWLKNKIDEKRFITNNIKFITINDNINYLFKRNEVK